MATSSATRMQEQYLETQVFSADPIGLVRLLYRGAIEAVGLARRHLADGRIRERSHQITRAWEILNELTTSLDHDAGGEISRDLQALYIYMSNRLLDANVQQADEPLAEVEKLLNVLAEAWSDLASMAAAA
jgi:flagellar secretion chaperone FliS